VTIPLRPPLKRLPALKYLLFAVIAVLLWIGYDTLRNSAGDIRDRWLSYKIERYISAHPDLSESDKTHLRAGQVVKGWNRGKCCLAWGEPDDILRIPQTQSEIWTYGEDTTLATLTFTKGILTDWSP
jgi:hypothetical protein